MKTMIGEIYRYRGGVEIYGGDGRVYVLLCDQKLRYIFFPFLFWLCPVEVIEIDEESITQPRDISLIIVLLAVIGAVVAPKLIEMSARVLINIPISTSHYWMIVLGIGILLRIVFRFKKKPNDDSIIAIHHVNFKPLIAYWMRKAEIWAFLSIGMICFILYGISSLVAPGQIILLIEYGFLIYVFLFFNYPFINVIKAQITFLD